MKKHHKPTKKGKIASAASEPEKGRESVLNELLEEIRAEEENERQAAALEAELAKLRDTQLQKTLAVLQSYYQKHSECMLAAEEEDHWARYMMCNGLPDPANPSIMNSFMFQLRNENEEQSSMDPVSEKCKILVPLLKKLEEMVQFSKTIPKSRILECEGVARQFKEQLQSWINMACYQLLSNIERNMVREDLKTARYVHVSDGMICCLWTPIALPIGIKKQGEKEGKIVEVKFDELDITVRLPVDMDCYRMAIRVLWLGYDYYSENATSRTLPTVVEEYFKDTDFAEFCRLEQKSRQVIRTDQLEERKVKLEEKRAMLESMEHSAIGAAAAPPRTATTEKKGKQKTKGGGRSAKARRIDVKPEPEPEVELPQFPSPEEIICKTEEEAMRELRKSLTPRCEKTEVNLRKYRILGGVFHVDLIYQPPQPKDMAKGVRLTTLQVPRELWFVPFSRPYVAPVVDPDQERTPEVIEAEMQALEAAMEALVLVTLKLPSTVLWFEPPLVAHWIPEKKIWSTNDVHDIKFNEEKQTIAFRTGILGIHGLAAHKFTNLPFQSWELKPQTGRNASGGVVFNISGAMIQVELVVKEDTVCLHSLVGGTSTALKSMLGEYMKPHHLIEKMREAGCDLFPERDTCVYVKGLAMKLPILEKHLRECMALLCTAYTFAWSRWNASRNLREIVIQYKELHGCLAKERSNLILLVTPMRTVTVNCTEVSPEFSATPLDGENANFYADLYHLALHEAGIKSKLLMKQMSFKLAVTVAELLERTSVISMSS